MGDQKIVDAISFLGKEDRTNILANNKLDELAELLILEINKKLPTKCEDCKQLYTDFYTNNPITKCFFCNIVNMIVEEINLKIVILGGHGYAVNVGFR